MAQQVVEEVTTALRLMIGRETSSAEGPGGQGGSSGFGPRRQTGKSRAKYPGVKRRSAAENKLSVRHPNYGRTVINCSFYSQERIREHMAILIPPEEWLEDVVYADELDRWDPARSECCAINNFKLRLGGTPGDDWNASAARVFTDDFLLTHAGTYPDAWPVRKMVLEKTRSHIKSLIKKYKLKYASPAAREVLRARQNRRERKALVGHRSLFGFAGC